MISSQALSLPNSLWSVGAGAVLPLFEGGLRRAALQRSWSQYAQARDNYRATVLSAFREVEDGLPLTVHLRTQARHRPRQSPTIAAKSSDERRCLPVTMRDRIDQPFATGARPYCRPYSSWSRSHQ